MIIKKIFSQKQLQEGEKIPKWYGVAYWEMNGCVVTYPIPINIIVSLSLRFWYWMVFFGGEHPKDKRR